ncbi:hypothetical protein O6H91_10G049000 [Diphasiastrum complanatum]|uniref:Uncharacterized protein n=1 Tax=Diphasiastrum complanatum TaxID=34168 RepID=A0ACC2CGU2_DIPCM|nr:hypothetical protein O6H91_10G049000 [Diphasiastrum complanatum]
MMEQQILEAHAGSDLSPWLREDTNPKKKRKHKSIRTKSHKTLHVCRDAPLSGNKAVDEAKLNKDKVAMKINTRSKSAVAERVSGPKVCDKTEEGFDQKAPKRTFIVQVCRPEEVEKSRSNLPIVMMEQEIMEAINENLVVIICGETGSGKTSQVPQFLYEAGYGSSMCGGRSGIIGVTQPRRVAVLATAKRVAYELNFCLGCEIGFQVRHDRKIGEHNCIKFMTDGILLRELQTDFLLRKYSVIILDEAHERSINTDILIGMLSRLLPLRQKLSGQQCQVQQQRSDQGELLSGPLISMAPLKLVIMSATLRVEDFTLNKRMFPITPPVVEVPTRQYPVTIHFSSKTELCDYETRALKKVCAIHQKLPAGGILVFLTGQRDVESLCSRLRKKFSFQRIPILERGKNSPCLMSNGANENTTKLESSNLIVGKELGELDLESIANAVDIDDQDNGLIEEESDASLGSADSGEESSSDVSDSDDDVQNSDEAGAVQVEETIVKHGIGTNLQGSESFSVTAHDGVSTSHGMRGDSQKTETSLTIPGIRYVVDCGRAKERELNRSTGISKFTVQWISKASAEQRAGRAGRTGPGHCYRLYSSAHFNNNFPEFSAPELSKAPIEGTVLTLKCMGIDKVINFPFPTPPDPTAVQEAEKCLVALSALQPSTKLPTQIGKAMATIPVTPRHARMLLAVFQEAQSLKKSSKAKFLVAYAIAVAAALSLENPFVKNLSISPEKSTPENGCMEDQKLKTRGSYSKGATPGNAHAKFFNPTSDAFSVVNALWAYERSNSLEQFCRENFLHSKTMIEMSKLRKQLSQIVSRYSKNVFPKLSLFEEKQDMLNSEHLADVEGFWLQLERISLDPDQEVLLQRAICAGWADRVARRLSSQVKNMTKEASKSHKAVRYQSCAVQEAVFLHPSSSVSKVAPEFVVYNELIHTSRPYMWGITCVKEEWLVSQAGSLCTFSKPLADPPPWYDRISDQIMCWVSPSFGPHLWELPLCGVPLKNGTTRTCIFALSLLQGKVLPILGKFRPYLSADPSLFLRPEGRVHRRVSETLHRLGTGPAAIDSKLKLAKMWEADFRFLYEELLGWIQAKYHRQFADLWESIREEAFVKEESLSGKKKLQKS